MLALVAYGLVSRRLDGTPVTGPMLFTLLGLLVGSAGAALVPMELSSGVLHALAEVTLILVLFSDAASIDLRLLHRDHNLPVRMLAIAMPLTILLGASVAVAMFPDFGLWEAALVAAILAPTDAALGQAVVANLRVPQRIRLALNLESGLNDGIALPFVLMFAAFATATSAETSSREWIGFALQQVFIGLIAGAIVGYVGAKLVALCYRAEWMSERAEGMIALGLAFGSFAAAEIVHGNGFIAAFVGGLAFGNTLKQKCRFLYEFAESEGQILILLTFAAFGAVMVPEALASIEAGHILFGVLALTVLRMLPVHLSLLGSGVRVTTSMFLGWFGPRGLASILFVILILEQTELRSGDALFSIVTVTVLLSTVLHGLSAGPGARWYGALTERMGDCEENQAVGDEPFAGT